MKREKKKRRGKNINLNQDTQNEDKNHTKDSIISQSHGGSTKISIERTCSKKNGGIKSTIQLENSFVYHDMTNISRKKWRHIDTASYYWPYYTQIGLMIVIDSESNFNLESLTMKGRAKGMILKGDVVS